ncbi:hypothetical protein ACFWTE_20270 [Nocardiopsis sp. NPDC058631]|uniref:hypothetical protein n=1 Tax=Nocardiopsis sp. NPDC058631 TaxID=3346566 RepID=UPI003657439B
MDVTAKLGLYALGLVAVFAAAFGVGGQVGPVLPQEAPVHAQTGEGTSSGGQDHAEDTEHGDGPSDATDGEERQETREGP